MHVLLCDYSEGQEVKIGLKIGMDLALVVFCEYFFIKNAKKLWPHFTLERLKCFILKTGFLPLFKTSGLILHE